MVVAGRKIATTAEHPFYVQDQSWVPAGQLRVGDWVHSHDGQWPPVTALELTGTPAQVYNFRIADHHTYFVGADDWGFSVWVHNSFYNPALRVNSPEVVADLRTAFNATERASFIKSWAATSGQAKRLLTPAELAIAARKGVLPDGFIVHHMVPLYRGGTNAFDNLRVMKQSFHRKFSELLHNYADGQNPYGI